MASLKIAVYDRQSGAMLSEEMLDGSNGKARLLALQDWT